MGGIILGAIGGAGEALENIGAKEQASQSARDMENLRASLEDQKEQRINAYKDQGATQAQGFLKNASSTQVPQEAAPVTSLSGDDPGLIHKTRPKLLPDGTIYNDITDPDARGFTGDPAEMRKTLNSWSDSADKTAALAQLDRQIAGEKATNQGIVSGKMRDRSSTESVDAAYDEAMKAGDVKAATAIKALQSDKFTKVGANEMVLDRHGRVVIANTAGADIAADRDASAERRANTRADATEGAAQIRADQRDRELNAKLASMQDGMKPEEKTKMMKDINFLTLPKAKGGMFEMSPEDALSQVYEAKGKSDEAVIMASAQSMRENGLRPPAGDKTDPVVYSVQQAAKALKAARIGSDAPMTPPSMPDLPTGAKLIGKTGGKDTYETPDGKRYVSQ